MNIITLKGTPEQIENLKQCIGDFDADRLPTFSKSNPSEDSLKSFLKFKKSGGFDIGLSLRAQGGDNTISTAPINLCKVTIGLNEYFFGGISEGFYDKMVVKYHKD
jgi:hypothetical protein